MEASSSFACFTFVFNPSLYSLSFTCRASSPVAIVYSARMACGWHADCRGIPGGIWTSRATSMPSSGVHRYDVPAAGSWSDYTG